MILSIYKFMIQIIVYYFSIRLGFIYIFQYLQGSCSNIIYYMQPIEVENLFNQILQNIFIYDYGEYQGIPIICVFRRHISGYVLHSTALS